MAKHIELEDGRRIARLSDLRDFQVAEGYKDIRGSHVESSEGKDVGKVHDLLVDLDGMRTRYIEVRLHPAVAATEGDRDVLIPVGAAQLAAGTDKVIIPLSYERISLLPAYVHPHLTRTYESELRRHFALGEAAALSDQEVYDDRRLFAGRAAAANSPAAPDGEIRVPVKPEDSVVLKRGENGHDEIIVRRPEA